MEIIPEPNSLNSMEGVEESELDHRKPWSKDKDIFYKYLLEDDTYTGISTYLVQRGMVRKFSEWALPIEPGYISKALLFESSKSIESIVNRYDQDKKPFDSLLTHMPYHLLVNFNQSIVKKDLEKMPLALSFIETMKKCLEILKHYPGLISIARIQGKHDLIKGYMEEDLRQKESELVGISSYDYEKASEEMYVLLKQYVDEFKNSETYEFNPTEYLEEQKRQWLAFEESTKK